jgi:hypothetical protein
MSDEGHGKHGKKAKRSPELIFQERKKAGPDNRRIA